MISGFARAAQALGDDRYAERAVRAAEFAKRYLYDAVNNRLLRSCYRGMDGGVAQVSVPISGFLDDYAFLIRALIDLYETKFDPSWLEWALNLQETQDKLFWDEGSAAYFMSPNTDQSILLRLKEGEFAHLLFLTCFLLRKPNCVLQSELPYPLFSFRLYFGIGIKEWVIVQRLEYCSVCSVLYGQFIRSIYDQFIFMAKLSDHQQTLRTSHFVWTRGLWLAKLNG